MQEAPVAFSPGAGASSFLTRDDLAQLSIVPTMCVTISRHHHWKSIG